MSTPKTHAPAAVKAGARKTPRSKKATPQPKPRRRGRGRSMSTANRHQELIDAEGIFFLFHPQQFPDRQSVRAFVASETFLDLLGVARTAAWDARRNASRNAVDCLIGDLGKLAIAAAQKGSQRLHLTVDEADAAERIDKIKLLSEVAQEEENPEHLGQRALVWLATDLFRIEAIGKSRRRVK